MSYESTDQRVRELVEWADRQPIDAFRQPEPISRWRRPLKSRLKFIGRLKDYLNRPNTGIDILIVFIIGLVLIVLVGISR
jgi:hypothetical protein